MHDGPELVIGLIGAVGTDLRGDILPDLRKHLGKAGYEVILVRLSELIRGTACFDAPEGGDAAPEDMRIDAHMAAGDRLRQDLDRGDAVALLALGRIRALRRAAHGDPGRPQGNVAYVLDSLKHPREIDTLRRIYGDNFLAIAGYAPRSERLERLSDLIRKSRKALDRDTFTTLANGLMEKDQKAPGTDLGQNVRDTFPKADYFVPLGKGKDVEAQVERFVGLVFGNPFATPTRDEYGMFHARAVALRSSDLSRQVGAVVLDVRGSIIANGCNEVPSGGGGSFWEGDAEDRDDRDFRLGYDSTAKWKEQNLTELFELLRDNGWLARNVAEKGVEAMLDSALRGGDDAFLKNARAANALEYGRIVHAEMNALMDAARRGAQVQGRILYCTTFPCHMCARHIIAAGLEKVVYIEPYPKSLAKELYRKWVRVEDDVDAQPDAVAFEPFMGVAPHRYMAFFDYRARKDERGGAIDWSLGTARPALSRSFVTYPEVEAAHLACLTGPAAEAAIYGPLPEGLAWLAAEVAAARAEAETWSDWKRRSLEGQVGGG